jgi:hypothetical protein
MNLGANFLYNFYFQEIMEFWVKKSDSYSLEAKLDLDKGLNIETASKKIQGWQINCKIYYRIKQSSWKLKFKKNT